MIRRLKTTCRALGWVVLITGAEMVARRSVRRRANAWLLAYTVVGGVAIGAGARVRSRSGWISLSGLVLAIAGYPLGRVALRDRPNEPPPDRLVHEAIALGTVAAAEELTWGAVVEPTLGPRLTALLFAAKHVVIDWRWRRSLGLFLFWLGLSKQRRRWPALTLVVHVALNGAGVVRGHRLSRDQF